MDMRIPSLRIKILLESKSRILVRRLAVSMFCHGFVCLWFCASLFLSASRGPLLRGSLKIPTVIFWNRVLQLYTTVAGAFLATTTWSFRDSKVCCFPHKANNYSSKNQNIQLLGQNVYGRHMLSLSLYIYIYIYTHDADTCYDYTISDTNILVY